MEPRRKLHQAFNVQALLESSGVSRTIVGYRTGQVVFSQGDPCDSVMYVQEGTVRLSVLSKAGKEAVVAMMGPGDFLGEGALAGRPVHLGTAAAIEPTTLLVIQKQEMTRLLHEEHGMSDRFIEYLLNRNLRVEADLVDQLFNSSEKRLARTLLLLARYGKPDQDHRVLPKISQVSCADV